MSFAPAGFVTGVIGSEVVSVRITILFASRACAVLGAVGVVADEVFDGEDGVGVPPLPQLATGAQAAMSRTIAGLSRRILIILGMEIGSAAT
jgi:hypothetical protein